MIKKALKNLTYCAGIFGCSVAMVGAVGWGSLYGVFKIRDHRKKDIVGCVDIQHTRLDMTRIQYSKVLDLETITVKYPLKDIWQGVTGKDITYMVKFYDQDLDGKVDEILINGNRRYGRNTSNKDYFLKADQQWKELSEELRINEPIPVTKERDHLGNYFD